MGKPLVAVVGDVHLANFRDFGGAQEPGGLNVRGRLVVQALERAVARARLLRVPLVVAGDLFHHRRPEPSVIAAAAKALREGDLVIPGNHDLIEATAEGGNTACAPLASVVCNVEQVARCIMLTGVCGACLVPFDARRPMSEVLGDDLDFSGWEAKNRLLVTHVGVVDDKSPPWLRDAKDAISANDLFAIMDRCGFNAAIVGNYHQHQEWVAKGMKIVQLGALGPTGFADEGIEPYGGFATWDGVDVKWESVPGPRFVRLRGQPVPQAPDGCSIFVRVDRGAYPDSALLALQQKDYAGAEVVDPAPGVLEQQDLAKPDRLLEGAEAAIEEYVSTMGAGDDKAAILEAVKGYWRRT